RLYVVIHGVLLGAGGSEGGGSDASSTDSRLESAVGSGETSFDFTTNPTFALERMYLVGFFFFSSRRRHTRCLSDWSSDVCSSDLREHAEPRPQRCCRRCRALSARSVQGWRNVCGRCPISRRCRSRG